MDFLAKQEQNAKGYGDTLLLPSLASADELLDCNCPKQALLESVNKVDLTLNTFLPCFSRFDKQ